MFGEVQARTVRKITLISALAVCCLPAPISAGDRIPTVSPQAMNREIISGYQVASGDKLRIVVFDEPSLSGEYQVSVEGDLSLPLLGSIKAEGLTTSGLGEKVANQLLAGGYVLVPRVSIEVIEHRPFFILGEVNKPGEYPYSGDLTLSQAVAKAGGYTPRANKKVILLERQSSGQKVLVKLRDQSLMIAPGDTVTIREAFF